MCEYHKLDPIDVKRMELKAIAAADRQQDAAIRYYFDGKAAAFAEIWALLVFMGRPYSIGEYNDANERYSKLAREVK